MADYARDVVTNGRADEGYDAADFQNMFLAWLPAERDQQATMNIPSFHRPALVNHYSAGRNIPWDQTTGIPNLPLADFWRTVIMRPTQLDHPNFTGSNRNPSGHIFGFDPVNGPWDVDNDGNGVEDSIWIDLGMPVQVAADGGLVKPLFAILCVDLDGRLNLNAHSSMTHVQPQYMDPAGTFPAMADFAAAANSKANVAGNPTSGNVNVLRSEGYGPADVYLGLAFELDSGFQQAEFEDFIERRYTGYDEPNNGVFGPGRPGFADSTLGLLPSTPPFGYEFYGATNDYARELSSFGNPPDYHGLSAAALDHSGQPLVVHLNLDLNPLLNFPASSLIDNPYEANLVDANGQDGLVGPADLAGILRTHDFGSYSAHAELFGVCA